MLPCADTLGGGARNEALHRTATHGLLAGACMCKDMSRTTIELPTDAQVEAQVIQVQAQAADRQLLQAPACTMVEVLKASGSDPTVSAGCAACLAPCAAKSSNKQQSSCAMACTTSNGAPAGVYFIDSINVCSLAKIIDEMSSAQAENLLSRKRIHLALRRHGVSFVCRDLHVAQQFAQFAARLCSFKLPCALCSKAMC